MELSVYKIDGSESGKKVVLDENIFGIEPNDHAMTEARLPTAPRSSSARKVPAVHATEAARRVSTPVADAYSVLSRATTVPS